MKYLARKAYSLFKSSATPAHNDVDTQSAATIQFFRAAFPSIEIRFVTLLLIAMIGLPPAIMTQTTASTGRQTAGINLTLADSESRSIDLGEPPNLAAQVNSMDEAPSREKNDASLR